MKSFVLIVFFGKSFSNFFHNTSRNHFPSSSSSQPSIQPIGVTSIRRKAVHSVKKVMRLVATFGAS